MRVAGTRQNMLVQSQGSGFNAPCVSLVPAFAALGNPIDLTPQSPGDSFVPAIEAVYADGAVDGIVAINCGLDVLQFGLGVARGVAQTGKPTTAYVLDVPAVEAEIAAAGVLRFASPERAVAALTTRVSK